MKHKDKWIIFSISLTVFLILAFINALLPRIEIKLNGNEKITLEVGTNYEESGAKAYIKKLFSKSKIDYVIEGTVDVNKLGKYELNYIVTENKKTKKVVRTIFVVDNEAPSITLNKPIMACKNSKTLEIDATIIDNYDGDISERLEYRVNKDKVTLFVSDSSNNKTEIEESLTFVDNDLPTIKLNGSSTIYLDLGDEYVEYGATAYDSCDGDLTGNIQKTGDVNTNIAGKYEVKYSITDSNSLTSNIIRTIVVSNNTTVPNDHGVIYLTFDDGPGQYTEEILQILSKYNIKATFFVTNQFPKYQYVIKKESEQGHTVGIHTYSHKWTVYQSVDTYLDDFQKIEQIVINETGIHPKLFRFPGGSSNTVSKKYCKGIMTELDKIMTEKGYIYFDWTFDSGDTIKGKNSTNDIIQTVKKSLKVNQANIILMHDIKKNTRDALPTIIEYGKAKGYTFAVLTETTPVKHFKIAN